MLILAVHNGWLEDVHMFIESGMPIDSREVSSYPYRGDANHRAHRGDTLIIIATRRNDIDMVKLLLSFESPIICDTDALGDNGMTALMWAAFNGNILILEMLLKYHRTPRHNLRNEEGYTPLIFAITQRQWPAAYCLIKDLYLDVDVPHEVIINGICRY